MPRLAVAVAILAAVIVRGQAAVQEAPHTHLGFTFSRGECHGPRILCETQQPKEWQVHERVLVIQALEEINAKSLGRLMLQRARANGYQNLWRYAQYLRYDTGPPPQLVPNTTARAVTTAREGIKRIEFNDAFFRCTGVRDRFTGKPGVAVTTMIVLHELMHAIDGDADVYSENRLGEFSRITGFVRRRDGSWVLAARSPQEVTEGTRVVERVKQHLDLGDCESAFKEERHYGVNVLKRLPSSIAVQRPREAFADIGMALILDPNATKYLNKRIVQFFETHVFR